LASSCAQAEVFAVRSGVLPDQRDFAGAGCRQVFRLAHHGLEAPAAKFSAKLRNDAERAGMIAAFRDFDVGGVARRGHNARGQIVVQKSGRLRGQHAQIAFHGFENALDLAGAHDGVHFGHLLQNLLPKSFDQASRDNQFLGRSKFLVLGHLQNGVDRFFLRGFDEAARVHHEHFRFIRARREFVTFARKNTHHYLAIYEVLRASQADKSDLSHKQ
jgi:hypothetical protein